jgi:hypothetical protein
MALTTTFIANKSAPTGIVSRATGYIKGTYTAATVTSATAASTTAAATGGIANADAVTNMVIGSGVMTITLGFVPKYFKIVNVSDGLVKEKFDGMATADHIHTAIDGTRGLLTDSAILISATEGSHGSSGGGGTAPASPLGIVTVTFATGTAICTDNDTVVWVAEG